MRKQLYRLYAPARGGPKITPYSEMYARGYRVIYSVYAASLDQARYLAREEIFATRSTVPGVREISIRGSDAATPPWESVPLWGTRLRAPYLQGSA